MDIKKLSRIKKINPRINATIRDIVIILGKAFVSFVFINIPFY